MSTLSGLASKGEKGKLKFQSLDINNLYRASRGESSEKQQQKSTPTFKHGMQSLGRVPSARRPPANLPSIKSEHSGTDAAVSLVPTGGPGWGKQDSATPSTSTAPSTTLTTTNVNANNTSSPATTPLTAHQAAIALPVTTTIPPVAKHSTLSVTSAVTDKSWSSVMSGNDTIQPPPYQSPQFQHEFPSLSAGDAGQSRSGTDIQYGPGPSLRPQTEGSWMQGGSRASAGDIPRSNSAPLGAPPQLSAQVGLLHQPLPPQYHGILPTFMIRGNTPAANGHGTSSVANAPPPVINNNRNRVEARPANVQRMNETEEMARRPIIKEEDLSRMDDMSKDMGWAAQDEIDYNQKLEFSDEETAPDKNLSKTVGKSVQKELESRERHEKTDYYHEDSKNWNRNGPAGTFTRGRNTDEDEILALKRKQQHQVVTTAAERAKQRKEEEEKKYLEAKLKTKRDKDHDDSQGTISPSVVPPQPITPTPIPVPDWEKDKEHSASTKSETGDDGRSTSSGKSSRDIPRSDFRQMAQIEAKNFIRKENRNSDRGGSGYPRQMQNLPPRFQKQQLRNNSSQPSTGHSQYDSRWANSGQNVTKTSPTPSSHKMRSDWELEKDRDDTARYSNEEVRRGTSSRPYSELGRKNSRYSDDGCDARNQDYDSKKDKDDNKWERGSKHSEKEDLYDNPLVARQSSDEWHTDRHEKYDKSSDRHERPQRPDSRDSRASRESRHSRDSVRDSEPREHLGSWTESITYEDRKKGTKEDRRTVPGPITKEKIEADEKQNEKRNLTQLKKGEMLSPLERKNDSILEKTQERDSNIWGGGNQNKEDKSSYDTDVSKPWQEDLSASIGTKQDTHQLETDVSKKIRIDVFELKEDSDNRKHENIDSTNKDKDDKKSYTSFRGYRPDNSSSQGWGRSGNTSYRWYKKPKVSRSTKGSSKGEWHTDSDASVDEMSCSNDGSRDDKGLRSSQRSPKPNIRKAEKEDKTKEITKADRYDSRADKDKIDKLGERKGDRYSETSRRDIYEPRGEPSRLGRGGGNMRGRGGLNKRMDGYGPPPKSPFGHAEEKEKKATEDQYMSNSLAHSQNYDKARFNAGIIGSARRDNSANSSLRCERKHDDKFDRGKLRRNSDVRKPKLGKSKDDNGYKKDGINTSVKEDKQSDVNKTLCNAISDISFKNKEQDDELESNDLEIEEKTLGQSDSDGFQEVKSKKTGNKERLKSSDEKPAPKQLGTKQDNTVKPDRKVKSATSQLSQQQIASIPSLMDTPVNPPAVIPQPLNKNCYDRSRNNKLPPRFAKQREQGRLQKAQMHQHNICEVSDINKVNQNIGLYGLKDNSSSMQINAWNKPIQLRNSLESDAIIGMDLQNCKPMDQPHSPGQNASPNSEKVVGKTDRPQIQDKSMLDGSTPPVNTIIFENTNYKSTPSVRNNRNDKARPSKMDESSSNIESSMMSGFNKPIGDLLSKNEKSDLQMQLSFNKEDTADMKLDFFESDISHLTDDKNTKNLSLPKSMHAMTSSNSTISPSTADLNFKIASVKKVWDNTMMPPVLEHSIGQEDSNSSFSASFGPDPNTIDASSAFSKGTDTSDDTREGYSSSPNQNVSNSTTNVCKVKPTQQVPGTTGQTVGTHPQHSGIISSGLIAPLSSPPIQPVIGPSVGLNQAPQQYTTNQHMGYQTGLGGSNQYGIPAIPSPPVVYNSTQQLQPQPASLYGGFPIDQLGGQRTSQFSQFANPYSLGQTASSPYSAQSLYLPTAQPHAPPTAQAPPDLYQSLNNYRIQNTAPYGQNQQLNNPTTVLISSTSNSLMSASVKPSTQPISAIGTKTGTMNQTFQQQSQQGQQPVYMTYEPAMQANYLPNTGVMQRGPPGPVQNNVVPALQASSSFYSGSTGGQTGYFQQPGNSTLQSGPLQQHQASYGLQGNVFGTHNQSHTSAGLQSLNFLSQVQFAMNVQQYRSPNLQNTSYLKSINNQQVNDQSGRSQQLKSPGTQQEVLSSVLNSGPGPQIPSPKSRQNCKHPPPQPSPTIQHKYLYQSLGNQQQPSQAQRYPQPIQRPSVNFQPNLNSVQNNGSNSHNKHRTSNHTNKGPPRQYYSPQGGTLSNQNEKPDDSKLVDTGLPNSGNSSNSNTTSIVNKAAAIGSVTNATLNKTEIVKDKDESGVIKD